MNWVFVGDKGQGHAAIEAVGGSRCFEQSLNEEAVGVLGGSDGGGAIVVEVNKGRVLDDSIPVFADGLELKQGFHWKPTQNLHEQIFRKLFDRHFDLI